MTEVNSDNLEKNNVNFERLNFKKSFWLIFTAIATIQIYNFSLAAYYGFDFKKFPQEFYLKSELGGIVWFIALLIVVIYDLQCQKIPPGEVFNFDLSITKKWLPKILKYFSGCTAFVVTMSFVTSETELHLEYKTDITIFLTFITVVILAPICEEMAFRGYLYTAMFSRFKRKKERMVVNAMLFACAHVLLIEFIFGANIPYYIFILGYLLAKLYEESRSVIPCILLHSLNNGLVFCIDIIKTFYLDQL